jgi:hypothetical protein
MMWLTINEPSQLPLMLKYLSKKNLIEKYYIFETKIVIFLKSTVNVGKN